MLFKLTNKFEGYDLETVYRTFLLKEFHTYKSQESGGKNIQVLDHQNENGRFKVSIKSEIMNERSIIKIPDLALRLVDSYSIAKLIGQEPMEMVYTESWPINDAEVKKGKFTIELIGIPASIYGTSNISRNSNGCQEDVTAHVDVKIPLLGSLVTKHIVDSLTKDFKTNHEVGLLFLDKHRGAN